MTLGIANLLQFIGGIILAVGYVPQITKIIKTRSVHDFSRIYLTGIFSGIVLMEIYAVYMYFIQHTAGAFFATNTIAFVLSGTEFFLVMALWNKKPKAQVTK
ncbi:PQ-loop repeat-containing protein [Priestia megaterium]|uniref:PQ-loop repeat-containing protein n=1 Tax=Priestia megaterium TaxID=1404 RepID=UPI0023DC0715|nr:PQ-loop repeat-containing protein [Priestia megaterium]MDF2010234.1 PQ-loop repeat-containing protein [Priestia megaterium]